jgi:rubrerythrin
MTLTKRAKERLKQRKKAIVEFKKNHNITKCQWCGHSIEDSCHHFLCPICWNIKQITSKHGMKKAKRLRYIQVNKINRNYIKQ